LKLDFAEPLIDVSVEAMETLLEPLPEEIGAGSGTDKEAEEENCSWHCQ